MIFSEYLMQLNLESSAIQLLDDTISRQRHSSVHSYCAAEVTIVHSLGARFRKYMLCMRAARPVNAFKKAEE